MYVIVSVVLIDTYWSWIKNRGYVAQVVVGV